MIAIDVMGGDFAPEAVLQGVLRYAKARKAGRGSKLCLFGPAVALQAFLDKLDSSWKSYDLTIVDAQDVIGMEEEPVRAVKRKTSSSLVKAVESVAQERCDAVVSAGNSGAMVAAALFLIGRNPGVERAPLVGLFPALHRPVVALDLGANVECKAKHLIQFAQLGVQLARDALAIEAPRVGLLTNGEEDSKGSMLTKEAFDELKQSNFANFIGNIEPAHVLQNRVDVVVSDGFVGNVFLKTFESTVRLCSALVGQKSESMKNFWHEHMSLIEKKSGIPRGGALLLGVKKTVVIVHGNASAYDIEHAIVFTEKIVSKVDASLYSL